jgi:hypothetical protein
MEVNIKIMMDPRGFKEWSIETWERWGTGARLVDFEALVAFAAVVWTTGGGEHHWTVESGDDQPRKALKDYSWSIMVNGQA